MGGQTSSAPAYPSPGQVAGGQLKANRKQAQMDVAFNRDPALNQADVFGNTISFGQTGTDANGNPVYRVSQIGSPAELEFRRSLRSAGMGGYESGLSALGGMIGTQPDYSQAAYDQAASWYDQNNASDVEATREATRNRLANQGFDPNSEAAQRLTRDTEDQIARNRGNFVQSAQNQFFNQGLQGRQQQIGAASGLAGLGQYGVGLSAPNFGQYASIPGVNTGQATNAAANYANQYNAQLAAQQQQQAQQNAMWGGLAGLGGTLLAAPMTGGGSLAGGLMGSLMGGWGKPSGYGNSWTPMITSYQ